MVGFFVFKKIGTITFQFVYVFAFRVLRVEDKTKDWSIIKKLINLMALTVKLLLVRWMPTK